MKRLLLLLGALALLLIGLVSPVAAQADAAADRSSEVLKKMRQVDLLNQILPLLLTKDQINKLLPAIERARQNVRDIERLEAQDLAKLDARLTEVVQAGLEKQVLPDREFLVELNKLVRAFAIRRQVAVGENVTTVLEAFDANLNAGQKKAAANSLNPKLFDPKVNLDTMTDEQKIRFFIQEILLDPLAYDVLKELAKRAQG